VVYTDVPERHIKAFLTKFPSELTDEDRKAIDELIQIKRRENPVWGF
jgi:translation initiation factor 5B